MEPQSAVGGWMPTPRKDSAEMVRNTKQKRRPNSAISGGRMLGTISLKMIQPMPSPRSLAASTIVHHHDVHRHGAGQAEHAGGIEQRQDEDQIDDALAEDGEQHQREDQHRDGEEGIDEARHALIEPAALQWRSSTPSVPPTMNDSSVVTSAMPMVLRAP